MVIGARLHRLRSTSADHRSPSTIGTRSRGFPSLFPIHSIQAIFFFTTVSQPSHNLTPLSPEFKALGLRGFPSLYIYIIHGLSRTRGFPSIADDPILSLLCISSLPLPSLVKSKGFPYSFARLEFSFPSCKSSSISIPLELVSIVADAESSSRSDLKQAWGCPSLSSVLGWSRWEKTH